MTSESERLDLQKVKQRALVRDRWRVGRIGDPVAWCCYCQVKVPGETMQEHESVLHEDGCPVPEALARQQPDFDALLAEAERLHTRSEILPGAPPIELRPGETVEFDAASGEVVVLRADGTERHRQAAP